MGFEALGKVEEEASEDEPADFTHRSPNSFGWNEVEEGLPSEEESSPYLMKGSTKYKARSRSVSMDFDSFYWDLEAETDLEASLRLLYSIYDQEQAKLVRSRISQAESKLELLKMLRQICRQYNLSEKDMQGFLDRGSRAHKKQERAMIRLGIDAMRTQKIKVRGCI